MNRNDFTPLEIKVLRALFASSRGNGHDFGFIEDGRKAVASPAQLGGVVASLVKKGAIEVYEAVTTDSGRFTQFKFNPRDKYDTVDTQAVLSYLWNDPASQSDTDPSFDNGSQ